MPNLANYNLAIVISEVRRGNQIAAVSRDLERLKNQAGRAVSPMNAVSASQTRMSKAMEVAGRLMRNVLIPGFLIGSIAAGKFALDGVRDFAKFDQAMRNTFTLLPGISEQSMGALSDDVRDVSVEYGRLTSEVAPALYQAISMGIPEDNAMEAIELASMAATAGVAGLKETMVTGQGVVNAYGGELYDLQEVYDILFTLIRFGVVDMNDLNQGLSNVTSVAAESRTPLEDIAAALVVMTRQGDSATEAFGLLQILMMQLGTDGTAAFKIFQEVTGESYRKWIESGKSLVEGLTELDKYAKETGQSISSMIAGDSPFFRDTQAARASLELTDLHIQELNDSALLFTDTSGSMGEAFRVQSEGIQYEIDQMGSAWEDFKLSVGEWAVTTGVNGYTAPELIDDATTVMKAAGGYYARQVREMIDTRTADIDSLKDWLAEAKTYASQIRTINIAGTNDEFGKGLREVSLEIAKIVPSYTTYVALLKNAGVWSKLNASYQAESIQGQTHTTEQFIELLYEEGQELQRHAIYYDQLEWAGAKYAREIEHRIELNEHQLEWQRVVNDESYWDQMSDQGIFTQGPTPAERFFATITEGAQSAAIVLDAFNPKLAHLSEASLGYFDDMKGLADELWDAYEDYQEAQGEYVDTTMDHTAEMAELNKQLMADLTDDQRKAYLDLLDTAEEGGAEWMGAWEALQEDLTTTQRREIVAQLSDLENAHATVKKIFTGNAEDAEEAQERITAALLAMSLAYDQLAKDMIQNAMYQIFGDEDNPQMLINMINFGEAVGDIPTDEADFLRNEVEMLGEMDAIVTSLTTILTEGDGILDLTESGQLVTAIDIVKTHFDTLTLEGLGALIEKATGIEGFSAIAAVITKEGGVQDELDITKDKANAIVDEGPYEPVIGADDSSFKTIVQSVWDSIEELEEETHFIDFAARYDDSGLPNPDRPGDPPEDEGHSGMDKIIPGGYPNDSYMIGVETGERVIVMTEAQQRANANMSGGGQYVDQRDQRVTMINNSKAAAAIGTAWLEVERSKRINEWMGS